MKKLLLVGLCLTLGLLVASTAMAFNGTWTPGTGINGTVHDMTTVSGYAASPADAVGGRICIYCHAPHNTIRLSVANGGNALGSNLNAADDFDYLPLWNHQLTPNAGQYSTYYNGPGEPASGSHRSQAIDLGTLAGTGLQPGSVSLLCLSCHDGSVAVNSYGTGPDGSLANAQPTGSHSGGGSTINAAYIIGQDKVLENHHPIGFDYDVVQGGDAEIRPSSTHMSNYNNNLMSIADHLYASNNNAPSACQGSTACMECATCHSVHNKNNTGERLLWRSDVNSQLCLTCHDKGTYTEPETTNAQALP